MRVCRGGRVKIGISALKTANIKYKKQKKKKKKKKKKEHSEIKQFGNNNNSVPKSKSI